MKKIRTLVQWLIAIALVFGLVGTTEKPPDAASSRAHPLLQQIAAQDPGQLVSVIVMKQPGAAKVEQAAARLGGEVTKDLRIIHAFAARMNARSAVQLASQPGVRWVSLDAPLVKSEVTTQTMRDEFTSIAYNGSNGTVPWASDWTEAGEVDGASGGRVRVVSWFRCASGSCLRLGGENTTLSERGAWRQANLSGVTTATLAFSYRRYVSGFNDASVDLQISEDHGSTWTTLATYPLNASDYSQVAQSFDITEYISYDTRFRFYGSGMVSNAKLYVDNVEIAFALPPDVNTYLATTGADLLHAQGLTGQGVTVAVVDSGIGNHVDLGNRLVAAPMGVDDTYGHGTHVAGIIGGDGAYSLGAYAGVAPGVNLISLDVSSDDGMAYESDVVAALQWIFENWQTYNVRVVNLSLNSTMEGSYHLSPMNAAAEILWFSGIVVVASAGNKGPGGGHNTAKTAPANDPFIIAVGASDEHQTSDGLDDSVASFSSFGLTQDGFSKPDIVAPGYNLISALSPSSPWGVDYPNRVVNSQYIRMSGTSMAAPVVAGAVALLLQDEPNLTPDQVKYRLLQTAGVIQGEQAYPYLNIYAAVTGTTTESANTGLTACELLWTGENPITWDSVAWNSVAWNSVAWNSVAWNSVAWNSAELNGIFWGHSNKIKDKEKEKGKDK